MCNLSDVVYDETGTKIVSQTPPILETVEVAAGYEPFIDYIKVNMNRRISTAPGKKEPPPPPQTPLPTHDPVSGLALKKVRVAGCWTPANKRGNAAFIYTFFRNYTEHFLPPDVPPVPQHLLFVFDAYKRQNIFETCKPNEEDVLAFGYFSSEEVTTCTLLAKTTEKYETLKPTV